MSGEQIESKLAKQDERINSIEKIVQMQISGIQKSIDELNVKMDKMIDEVRNKTTQVDFKEFKNDTEKITNDLYEKIIMLENYKSRVLGIVVGVSTVLSIGISIFWNLIKYK